MNTENTGAAQGNASESPAVIQPPSPQVQSIDDFRPRKLAGLTTARIVNYVMLDAVIRPLIVIDAGDQTGSVNGVLFFDAADILNHPQPLLPDASGHAPTCARLLRSVQYDEAGAPGTWHWPKREPVIAANVDANAINTTIAAMLEPVYRRVGEMVTELVSQKLEATVEHVNQMLASHDAVVLDLNKRLDAAIGEEEPKPEAEADANPAAEIDVTVKDGVATDTAKAASTESGA